VSHLLTIYRVLTSLPFVPVILILLAGASIPGTFLMERGSYYGSLPFVILLSLLVLVITICTIRSLRGLRLSVIMLHAGFVIVCLGGVIRGVAGYVATVNVYEGGSIDQAYRWDLQRDETLGFTLTLRKISFDQYPVPLRIGILKNGEKYRLVTTAEGKVFTVDGIHLVADRFDPDSKVVSLSRVDGEGRRTPLDTSEPGMVGEGGARYAFRLVAWQEPAVKRSWVELLVRTESGGDIAGVSEVNAPFSLDGVTIHHVKNGLDSAGKPYAGLQIVRDPGRPVVFAGMLLASAGGILLPLRPRRGTISHDRS